MSLRWLTIDSENSMSKPHVQKTWHNNLSILIYHFVISCDLTDQLHYKSYTNTVGTFGLHLIMWKLAILIAWLLLKTCVVTDVCSFRRMETVHVLSDILSETWRTSGSLHVVPLNAVYMDTNAKPADFSILWIALNFIIQQLFPVY